MPASADKGFIAGGFYCQIMTRSSAGYPMGSDSSPSTFSALDVKHAYKVKGFVSVDAPQITREIAIRRAGQKVLGQKSLGVSSFGTFNLTLSDWDEAFHNLVSGATIDTALATNWAVTSLNSGKATLPQFILLIGAGYQNDAGADQFLNIFYHNVTIAPTVPSVTQSGGENPNALTYTVTPSSSLRAGWGSLFSATALALEENSDIVSFVRTELPLSVTTYIDDASATSFVLGYRPSVSEHAGADNLFLKNGVQAHTSVSGVNTTSGVVTITAGSSLDIWTAIFQTSFVSI